MDDTVSEKCLNCDALLDGAYCSNCGQKHISGTLTFNYFVKSFIHEIANTDSRIWHTVIELVKSPGFVARQYVLGARQKYINPLRLCLVLVGGYIAFLALNGWLAVDYRANTANLETEFLKAWADLYSNHRLFIYLASIPIAAYAIRWGFYKSRYNYAATLIMLLFVGALYSLYGITLVLIYFLFGLDFFSPSMDISELIIGLVVYYQGVKSFYEYGWFKSLFATLWVFILLTMAAYLVTFATTWVVVSL
ncbi:MAG: DUF3667 domain-containing protein [Kordiimonas sp.]